MVAGLGLLLVSGMGIVCGWQPMPDGDASYECVIQLEPELVSTLKDGGSIPLSVDIPEHVRPIKRVRIVVGSGQVPQQSLLTNLKPSLGDEVKQSREGIVEAQYRLPNNSGDERYHTSQTSSQQILPPGGNPLSSQEAFAQSLQNGGQAVRDAATQAAQDILPPDPSRSISGAVDRSSQQMSSEIRNVGDTVNSNIRQLFGGESSNSVTPPGVDSQDSQILPPGSEAPASNLGRREDVENGQTILPPADNNVPSTRRIEQPLSTNQGRDWQSRNSAAPTVSTGGNPPPSSNPNFNTHQPDTRTMQPGASPSTFPITNSRAIPQSDRYGRTIQPPPSRVAIADNRNGVPATGQSPESGPGFPEFNPAASPTTPASPSQSNVPEIRRAMLDSPANSDLQGANGQPIAQQNSSSPPTADSQPTPPPTDFNWNTQTQPPAQQQVAQAGANPAPLFPLLLSWVLLSGSGAGNLYLFWSYLDIRNKYRDVLYDASRKLSGRGGRE